MKRIITAIGNNFLNENLVKLNRYEIPIKDIQYKEGILEFLKENSDIDILIISEILDGEIDFKKLISKILKINSKVDIIVFVDQDNRDLKSFLYENGIYKIYENNQLNLREFIDIIESETSKDAKALEEEIKKLRQIIEEQKSQDKINKKLGKITSITGSYGFRKKYYNLYTLQRI